MFAMNVNWLAVVVCVVAQMALGFLWYSPTLFAKPWMAAMGKTQDQMGNPGPAYALTIVGAFIEALVLAWLVGALPAPALVNGAIVGLLAAIGFVATTFGATYLFSGANRMLYLINVGYHVIGLVVMGAILGAWR